MSKLLSANFLRIKKDVCFWVGVCLMALAGACIPLQNYINMKKYGATYKLDDGFFLYVLFAAIFLSAFCSLFVGTEYGDGTIRNKIIVGHERKNIYITNLLTNMLVSLFLYMVYMCVFICVGTPLLGFFGMDWKTIAFFTFTIVMLLFAFSALFTLLAMSVANKPVVAIISILGTFFLLLLGSFINSRLQAPETYPSYMMVNEETQTEEVIEEKNPRYLEGTEREVYQFFLDFLPGGQIVQIMTMEMKHPYRLPAYSGIIFVVALSVGMAVFQRKDIK